MLSKLKAKIVSLFNQAKARLNPDPDLYSVTTTHTYEVESIILVEADSEDEALTRVDLGEGDRLDDNVILVGVEISADKTEGVE